MYPKYGIPRRNRTYPVGFGDQLAGLGTLVDMADRTGIEPDTYNRYAQLSRLPLTPVSITIRIGAGTQIRTEEKDLEGLHVTTTSYLHKGISADGFEPPKTCFQNKWLNHWPTQR